MCKFCDFPSNEISQEYITDEPFEIEVNGYSNCIDNVEAYIQDNIDTDTKQLVITSTNWDIEMDINFCPMCGERI